MTKIGVIFTVLIVAYAVLQMIFDSAWLFVVFLTITAFCLGFITGIHASARAIKEGKVKLP